MFSVFNMKRMAASYRRNYSQRVDEEQTKTVEEHFDLLFGNDAVINSEHTEVTPEDLPDFYDEVLFLQGQSYFKRNMLSMTLVGLIGVLSVLSIPSILKILIHTKQSSTSCTAFKRYLETIIHITELYTSNIRDKNSNWWKSINVIRWKHSRNSQRSSEELGNGITQRDMALTQFGFIGYALLAADKLSLTNEPEGREGLNHFWRVVGHLLGINDKMNICRKNQEETTALCKLILDRVYVKEMRANHPDVEHMTRVLVDGLWSVDVTLDYPAIMHLWYQISGLPYNHPLSTYSWLNVQYRACVLYLQGLPFIGYFVREGFNCYLRLNHWLVQRYPLIAYLRFGKSNATINVYPETKQTSDR